MAPTTHEAAKRLSSTGRWGERGIERLVWPVTLVAAGLAAVALLVLLARARTITGALYRHADVASAPMIAELLGEAPDGSTVVLGNYPWYEALWYMDLTRGLPAHRELWALAPWLLVALGFAAAVWAAGRVAGRWAAITLLALIVPLSTITVLPLGAATQRGHTVFHVALLAAFVCLVVRYGPGWSALRLVLVSALAALITAPGVASDILMLPAALVPLLAAAAAILWVGAPRRAAIALGSAAVAAGVGGVVIHRIAEGSNIVTSGVSFPFASGDAIAENAWLLVQVIAAVGHGDFFGREVGLRSLFALVCAVLALGLAVFATRAIRARLRPPVALTPPMAGLLAFWAASALASGAAFIVSSAPLDLGAVRYVLWLWPAIATLAVLLAETPRARLAVAASAAVLAVGGIVDLLDYATGDDGFAPGHEVAALHDFAREEGFAHGYAGPWDAANMTWQTDTELKVYPVQQCSGSNLCRAPFHTISSWYSGSPSARTFIVTSDRPTSPVLTAPDPAVFGKPDVTRDIGQLHVYGYDYDIAERLQSR